MTLARLGPPIGLLGLLATLAALRVGGVGWVVGILYGLALAVLVQRGLRGSGMRPADWVTLTRANLVGAVTALIAASFTGPVPVAAFVAITTVALVLDAVDGKVARRTRTASDFGARFDMETDAFLILALSLYVARDLGIWVLAIGLMRYVYVAAGWLMPWLQGRVPPRYWRKVVAAVQGIVLLCASSGVFPRPLSLLAVVCALLLLCESFGRDIVWQWAQPREALARSAGRQRSRVDVA